MQSTIGRTPTEATARAPAVGSMTLVPGRALAKNNPGISDVKTAAPAARIAA